MRITANEINNMIKKCFELYDADKSGFLEKGEIRTLINDLMAELNAPNVTDDILDKIIASVDENNDGKFDFGEFFQIINPIIKKALI